MTSPAIFKVLYSNECVCRGLESLKIMLPFYDSGSGTFYDLRHYTMKTSPKVGTLQGNRRSYTAVVHRSSYTAVVTPQFCKAVSGWRKKPGSGSAKIECEVARYASPLSIISLCLRSRGGTTTPPMSTSSTPSPPSPTTRSSERRQTGRPPHGHPQ